MPNLTSLIKSIRDIMREDRGLSGDGQRIEQLAWMLFLKIMDDRTRNRKSYTTTTCRPCAVGISVAQLSGQYRGSKGRKERVMGELDKIRMD